MESAGEAEKRVLLFGGIGGILFGVVLVLAFGTFFAIIAPNFTSADEIVRGLREFRTPLTVVISLLVVGFVLFLPFTLGLWRGLRKTSPASALLGSILGVIGVALSVLGQALIFVVDLSLSDLYAVTAPQDQMGIVLARVAIHSPQIAALYLGFLVLGVAFVSFGVAMLGSADFPKGFAWGSIVLGLALAVGIAVTGAAGISIVGYPIAIVVGSALSLLLGWKLYGLSRAA